MIGHTVFLYGQIDRLQIDQFIIGADISMSKNILDQSGVYKLENQPVDLYETLVDKKFTYGRIRLFHTPNGEQGTVNSLEYSLELARSIKDSGLKLLLDFHYSDWWADPSQQSKPQAWEDLDFDTLNDSLYNYTKYILNKFAEQGLTPDLVQPGNEINHGFLWPDGATWKNNASNWPYFTTLLKSAILGIRESNEGKNIPIIIHGVYSTDRIRAKNYIDSLQAYQVPFDILGMSYYQCWDGPLDLLEANLEFLDQTYPYDIILAESSYPADGSLPEWCIIDESEIPFPLSEQGQYDYLQHLHMLLNKYPSVKGMFYWGGELIWAGNVDGSYESLFHWQGESRIGLCAFSDMVSINDTQSEMNRHIQVFKTGPSKITIHTDFNEPYNLSIYSITGKLLYSCSQSGTHSTICLKDLHQMVVVHVRDIHKNHYYSKVVL